MAPTEVNVDYYAILEISNIATIEIVTKSYRRLAKIRHPDKNLSGDSTAVFQLLQNAYDTISDSSKRRAYDLKWPGIRDSLLTQQDKDKRQAEAAKAEAKFAAEAKAKKAREDLGRQERLRNLQSIKSRYDSDIFELSRAVRKLEAEVKRFQDQDDEDVRQEKARNSWWAYLASPVYGKADVTAEEKQARETARLHRVASKSIRGSELDREKVKLQRLQSVLEDVNGKIAAEKKAEEEKRKLEDEARARQQKMEDEARARKQRMEEEEINRLRKAMHERAAKAQKELFEKAAKEAKAAREAQQAAYRARAAAAAMERLQKEAEERAEAIRRTDEANRKATRKAKEVNRRATKAQTTKAQTTKAQTSKARPARAEQQRETACRHDRFWPKIEGSQTCSNCHALQRRFAFQCPGCNMVACANCRQRLRGEKRGKGASTSWHYEPAGDHEYGNDDDNEYGTNYNYNYENDHSNDYFFDYD